MVGKFLRLLVIYVVNVAKACVAENSLIFRISQCLCLNCLFETEQGSELSCDRLRDSLELNLLLAAGARHEREGNSQGCPFVLE